VDIKSFAIEELDKFVGWYENFRPLFEDDGYDFHAASLVSSWFIQAGYKCFFDEQLKAA
jgi:hypothetical protein